MRAQAQRPTFILTAPVPAGAVAIGAVFQAKVPIGTDIAAYADDELVGMGGSNGGLEARDDKPAMYASGPGGPATASG